jgi:hypothetical protein
MIPGDSKIAVKAPPRIQNGSVLLRSTSPGFTNERAAADAWPAATIAN